MTEPNLKVMFGTPLIQCQLEDPELNAELEEAVLRRRRTQPSRNRYNRGGWQSDMRMLSWGASPVHRLATRVAELADFGTRDVRPDPPLRQNWLVQAWANVSEAGAVHLPHGHTGISGCFWSAVYYVRCEEDSGGELLFYDPRGSVLGMHARHLWLKNAGVQREYAVKPKAGLIVVFPSWLVHAVSPYTGTEPRISIALNLSVEASLGPGTMPMRAIRAEKARQPALPAEAAPPTRTPVQANARKG